MKPSGIIGLLGMVVGLAALSVIAARPAVISNFFTGSSRLLGTATGPVTGYRPR
jgi:hypothetical protein